MGLAGFCLLESGSQVRMQATKRPASMIENEGLLSPIPFGWPLSTTSPDCLELRAQVEADVATIEAGFTGLSAALHLS